MKTWLLLAFTLINTVQSIIFCPLGRLLCVGTSQAAQTEQKAVTPTSWISFLSFKADCLHGQRCKRAIA